MTLIRKKEIARNELGYDAWGRPKTITDESLFHGMFTYNVPVTRWSERFNGSITPITNCTSVDGALSVIAGATLNDKTYLRTYRNPRYEPNRGAIYSTAGWFDNPSALMVREWGTFTDQAGIFFRLKSILDISEQKISSLRKNLVKIKTINTPIS